jgi:hypothetical protein
MKKLGLIILVVVMALGVLGVGYAAWSQTININADVQTGTLAATIAPNGVATIVPNYVLVANEPSAPSLALTLDITNAVPGAVITIPYIINNTGTIPCNVAFAGFGSWTSNGYGTGWISGYADSNSWVISNIAQGSSANGYLTLTVANGIAQNIQSTGYDYTVTIPIIVNQN